MSGPIRSILVIFESADNHYAFRYIRCRDGKMVEARITGGEGNIKAALHNNMKNGNYGEWRNDYFYTIRELPIRKFHQETNHFEYAGCAVDEIRSFVERNMGDGQLI